jgi:hypothetical protein
MTMTRVADDVHSGGYDLVCAFGAVCAYLFGTCSVCVCHTRISNH